MLERTWFGKGNNFYDVLDKYSPPYIKASSEMRLCVLRQSENPLACGLWSGLSSQRNLPATQNYMFEEIYVILFIVLGKRKTRNLLVGGGSLYIPISQSLICQ
jgi:hypothetical protein